MIKDFEIKRVNGEDVLYLFLDYSVEFAKLGSTSKKTTLNKEIDDFMAKKKIKFKGNKIILIASGLVLGACLLKTPLPKEYPSNNYSYATNIITLNENFEELKKDEAKPLEVIKEEVQKESTNKVNTSTSKKPTSSSNSSSNNKTTSNSVNNKNTNSNNNPPIINNNVKEPDKVVSETKPSQIPEEAKQMVSIKRSNGSIISLELEEYIVGVVAAEMPASFSLEALKAQAVAARTYALKAIQNKAQLTDTVSTQVYKDNNQLKAMWGNSYNTYYNKVKNAVNSTKGLAMYYNGSLINAYYFSTSNGYTEDASAVFKDFPYLKSVESSVDKNVASYLKTITLTYEDISNKLGVPITSLSNITIEKNNSNRVGTIIIDNNSYSGVKFRTLLGLRSTDFDIVLNENDVSITTRGYGHGVGMSQYGAHEYAKQGWNYTQILKHYYSGITIK